MKRVFELRNGIIVELPPEIAYLIAKRIQEKLQGSNN